MPIYMNNYTPQNIFANMSFWRSNGIYGPTDLEPGEWQKRRGTFLSANRSLIESTTGAGLPLRDMANYAIGMYDQAAFSNIDSTIDAWHKLKSIAEGSGVIYGWDLETFGDAKAANAIASGAGISEIGISRTIFDNGVATSINDYSILIKMNQDQAGYVREAINVLQSDGWDHLSEAQKVTLNRVSKYRTAGTQSAIIDFMGGKSVTTVYGLGSDMGRSVTAVEAGLKFLTNNGSELNEILPGFVNVLQSASADNIGLMGANTSGFDEAVLKAFGVNQDALNIIHVNTGDITMAHREIAAVHNMSTNALNQTIKQGRTYSHDGSNTVTSINEALGYDSFASHVAGEDAGTTVKIGTTQKFLDNKSFIETLIESHAQYQAPQEITEDSIVYLNNGWLNPNSLDQVRIGSDTTHNYSIRSSYWKFDTEKSGYITWTPEGATSPQEAYVLSFKSAADDGVEFSKAFESPEKAAQWTVYNGTFLSPDDIKPGQLKTSARYNLLDFGRREYERFFDSNSVGLAGTSDTNGVASLRQYLGAFEEVETTLTEQGIEAKNQTRHLYTKEGMASIGDILTKHGIKTDTQQRAFIGMYGKLQDEYDVLKHIVVFTQNYSNLTGTTIAHNMHEAALQKLSAIPGAKSVTPYQTYIMDDVFSIDILGADGNYHAIRGNTTAQLTNGIRYLYEDSKNKGLGASLNDMKAGIIDLHDRGVIDDAAYRSLMSNLKSQPAMFDASKDVALALDDIFQPFRDNSGLTVYKSVMAGTNVELDDTLQARIIAKHAKTPISLSLQGMYGTRVIDSAGNAITLNNLFANSTLATAMNSVGTTSANTGIVFTKNLIPGGQPSDEVMALIADRLGYTSTSQQALITQMFTGGRKDTYSINAAKDKGVISALVLPHQKGNSGFIVLTNQQHQNQTYRLLSEIADKDLTAAEMRTHLKGHASIFELKALHTQEVGDMPANARALYASDKLKVTYVTQGSSSIKYMHAGFDFYEVDNVVHGGLQEAGNEVLTVFRKNASHAFGAIEESNFDEADAIFRRGIDAVLEDKSGSSSNQGIFQPDGGKLRGINFNESDILHGGYFEYGEGLNIVAKKALDMDSAVTNPLVNLLTVFNESLPEQIVDSTMLKTHPTDAYSTIMDSPQWKEFSILYLNEPINTNKAIRTYLRNNASAQSVLPSINNFNMTYFDLITSIVTKDTSGTHVSLPVQQALLEYQKVLPHMTQVYTKTNVLHGVTGIISPGAFSVSSPGAAINRPVFQQQLNARNIAARFMPVDYLDRIGSTLGSLTVTPQTAQWMELNNIIMPDGTMHADQISSITTTYKQVGEAEIIANYERVRKNIKRLAKSNGLDADLLSKAFNLTYDTMPSVYEGSAMMSSTLATAYHNATTDTKKMKFDRIPYIEDATDLAYTKEKLYSLIGQKVDRNTIIGHDSKGAIYWDGFETVLTERNVQEILSDGTTTIVPTNVISSRKFMLGGSEKFIANGVIVNDELVAKAGFQSAQQAHEYLDFVFEQVIGGGQQGYIPSLAANLKTAKHISGEHLHSALNVIVNEYQNAGKLDVLVAGMRRQGYNWNVDVFRDMLHADTLNADFVSDMMRLINDIQGNHIGQKRINKRITDVLQAFNDNNMLFASLQSNIQTQNMGEYLQLDPRVEAAYRRRDEVQYYLTQDHAKYTINGERFEDIIMDSLRADTLSGRNDYMHASDLGGDAYAQAIERISKEKNAALIKHRKRLLAQEDVLTGISEAAKYMANPTEINRNIVEVNMEDLINRIPASTKENIQDFIYRINGEYSPFLIQQANSQGIDLAHGSYTVAVNLGREFNVDGVNMSKILVPIYDVYGDYSDAMKAEDTHFAKSMGSFHSLMHTYKENINKPSAVAEANIAKSISQYGISLVGEMATDDKTALGFKTYGKFQLPNSAYLLGQDEIAAVTKEMLGLDMDEKAIQKAIRKGDISKEQMLALLHARTGRANTLKEIADGGSLELLGSTHLKGYSAAKNGGFLNVIAVNRNTFEQALDFDIGVFGKSIYDDIVSGTNNYYTEIGQRKFSITSKNIGQYEDEIYEQLSSGLSHQREFVRTGNLSHDINQYFITIEDLNNQIIDKASKIRADELYRNDVARINQAFDAIGSTYLREIGVTTDLAVRHPAFAMGTAAANLILDDAVGPNQLRALSPLYSALMNLDHDGDAMGIAIRNATRAMKKNDPAIAAAMAALEKNALTDVNILRNMIESGDAFKTDRVSDILFNEVQALKAYAPDDYKAAKESVMSSLGVNRQAMIDDTLAQLTGDFKTPAQKMKRATTIVDDAIDYTVTYAPQMMKAVNAYNQSNGNFLLNVAANRAALKAKVNQDMVGMISNESFSLHDAVHVAFSQSDTETKKRLASLYVHMDNISEEGMDGLMTLAEQKGIDTKHILDAENITSIPSFTKGMKKLMAQKKRTPASVEKGLVNVMQSLGNLMFKGKTNQELHAIAQDIMSTSIDDYTKLINTTADVDLAQELVYKRQLRALYELSNEQSIRVAYNSPLRRPDSIKDFAEGVQELRNYVSDHNMASKLAGTYTATSDAKLGILPNSIYVSRAGMNESQAFIMVPHAPSEGKILRKSGNRYVLEFKGVNLTDGSNRWESITFSGRNTSEIMDKVNKYFMQNEDGSLLRINAKEFSEGRNAVFRSDIRKAKTRHVLNNFYLSGTDNFMDNFHRMATYKKAALATQVGTQYYSILDQFSTTSLDELHEIQNYHEFLRAHTDTKLKDDSYGALIRQINANIVNNPEKYGNTTEFPTYNAIIRDYYRNILESEGLKDIDKLYKDLGHIDFKAYNKVIDLLRANTYDIMLEEDILKTNLQALEKYSALKIADIDKAIAEGPTSIGQTLNPLRASQIKKVHLAEDGLYKLFGSQRKMNIHFGWTKPSDHTIVGFGQYMGYKFSDLGQADIAEIFRYASTHKEYYLRKPKSLQAYAYNSTVNALQVWHKTNPGKLDTRLAAHHISERTQQHLGKINDLATLGKYKQTLEESAKATQKQQQAAAQGMKKNTIRGSLIDGAKGVWDKMPKKAIGVAVGAMAAIGIANNMLHNQRTKSPLAPSRREDGSASAPVTSNGHVQSQAPMSQRRTVYHDSSSGYQFKVSAKTSNYINDANNARLIGMSGGGNPSVYTESDMSGVTDNWLANKFAELT